MMVAAMAMVQAAIVPAARGPDQRTVVPLRVATVQLVQQVQLEQQLDQEATTLA